jgi:glutathione S-transferase
MYELFIGNKNYSSWSLRPWLLMRELAIPFTEHLVPFEPGSSFEKFRAFSPSGRVPCLRDGGTAVWDSLAITEYLAEERPEVWPADRAARAFARCAAAEMHSGFQALRNICTMNCGLRIRLHGISHALQADVTRIAELWSEGLRLFHGPFLAGRTFTAVDAFFAPVAFRVQTYGLRLGGMADAYARQLLSLPALREWYQSALEEPWREEDHERDASTVGTIIEDLRAGGPIG